MSAYMPEMPDDHRGVIFVFMVEGICGEGKSMLAEDRLGYIDNFIHRGEVVEVGPADTRGNDFFDSGNLSLTGAQSPIEGDLYFAIKHFLWGDGVFHECLRQSEF